MDYLDRKNIKPLLRKYFLEQDFLEAHAGEVKHASEYVAKKLGVPFSEEIRHAVRYELGQMKLAREIVRVRWGVYRPRVSH